MEGGETEGPFFPFVSRVETKIFVHDGSARIGILDAGYARYVESLCFVAYLLFHDRRNDRLMVLNLYQWRRGRSFFLSSSLHDAETVAVQNTSCSQAA